MTTIILFCISWRKLRSGKLSECSNRSSQIHLSRSLANRHHPLRDGEDREGVARALRRGLFRRLLPVVPGQLSEDIAAKVLWQEAAGICNAGANLLPPVLLK